MGLEVSMGSDTSPILNGVSDANGSGFGCGNDQFYSKIGIGTGSSSDVSYLEGVGKGSILNHPEMGHRGYGEGGYLGSGKNDGTGCG